jgi:hypothetical protein
MKVITIGYGPGKNVVINNPTLRLNVSNEGVDSPEEFSVSNIKGVKVIFTPSSDLKKALEDIYFEEEKEKK